LEAVSSPAVANRADIIPFHPLATSGQGIALIKFFEGFAARPYLCPANYWTVGYGHVITHAEKGSFTAPLDESAATELLMRDLVRFEQAVRRLVKVALNQQQFDALVSFTFNLGAGALQRSTLRQKLNRGDYAGAAGEFRKWIWAAGRKLPGLIRRRDAEKLLFQA
jgi:lysozyme